MPSMWLSDSQSMQTLNCGTPWALTMPLGAEAILAIKRKEIQHIILKDMY